MKKSLINWWSSFESHDKVAATVLGGIGAGIVVFSIGIAIGAAAGALF